MKQNNNNSKGVGSNEQYSSNVKEAPNPKQTKCTSITKVKKWDDTYLRYRFSFPNCMQQIHSSNASTTHSLNFLLYNFCNM